MRMAGHVALRIAGLCLVSCLVGGAASEAAGASITGSIKVLRKGGAGEQPSFANAVVWVSGPDGTPSPSPVIVNQLNKKFHPRVLPVMKGQVVHFMNQDKIEHNVFSRDSRNSFDLGRYPRGEYRPVKFDALGIYKVYCNIHKAMILDVVVVDSPYFAVTSEDGVFSIEGVPPGAHTLNVWHIYGGRHKRQITLGDEPLVLEPITVTSTKVTRDVEEHMNKKGRPYKKGFYDEGRRR
jgi:plastocyanin